MRLQRAALIARITRGRPPDPLAGLKVDDQDIQSLLSELPGLAGWSDHEARRVAEVDETLGPTLRDAERRFLAALDGEDDGGPPPGSPARRPGQAGSPGRGSGPGFGPGRAVDEPDGTDDDGVLDAEAAFAQLVASAGLSAPEAKVLAVLCAVEVDPRRQQLVGYLNDDVTQRRVTVWTLALLFGPAVNPELAVGPGSRLRRAALLAPPGDGPWASSPIVLAPAVLWWLRGDQSPDPDLPPGLEILVGPAGGRNGLVAAASPDRVRRLQAAVAALPGEVFLVTPVPDSAEQWDALIRQATLVQAGVVLEIEDDLPSLARRRVELADHVPWAIVSPRELPLASLPRRPWVDLPVAPRASTAEEWEATLGIPETDQYHLSAEQLHLVGRASAAMGGDVAAAVRRLAAGHIDATATRVRPTRGWDDIVLDADRMGQLREVALRCRYRDTVFNRWGFSPLPSTGVVALFAGPSGTGKTLAAEVIAGDLGIDLYKVDLANLVSKYIGETEKNLARVFDAAEASNVALFFDEADALLGRRSEVSDAHDRYANIEVAYLLQRLERYEGLAVMATNLAKNIDSAFLRRIHSIIDFPMPGPAERGQIWAQCLPAAAPTDSNLDLKFLANTFDVSGGTIRNTVLTAAFLAAEASSPITMATLVVALRRELRKLGRLVRPADFGPHAALLSGSGEPA